MAKSEWGMKRTCLDCGAPFYDLKKKNIVCPKCGTVFDPAPPAKPKRSAPVEKPAPEPDVVPGPVEEEATEKAEPFAKEKKDAAGDGAAGDGAAGDGAAGDGADGDGAPKDDDGDDDDKDLIEDTSDLGRDDDDMSEVKEHIDDGVEDKN